MNRKEKRKENESARKRGKKEVTRKGAAADHYMLYGDSPYKATLFQRWQRSCPSQGESATRVKVNADILVGQSDYWTLLYLPKVTFSILICKGSTTEIAPEVLCPPQQNPTLGLNLLWILSAQKKDTCFFPFLKTTHPGWRYSLESLLPTAQ